jgi:hypothetical protein
MQKISMMSDYSSCLHPPLQLSVAYFCCRRNATALLAATIKNSIEIARILLQRGANVSATSEFVLMFCPSNDVHHLIHLSNNQVLSGTLKHFQEQFDSVAFCCTSKLH